MLLESQFQSKLIEKIEDKYPGAVVLKNDPTYKVGIPDIVVLFGRCWAALEPKRTVKAVHGPNQDYYVSLLDDMSFASFIYPENEREVMRELQRTFQSCW